MRGLLLRADPTPGGQGRVCPQPLDDEGARNGSPGFTHGHRPAAGCFLTHHAPEPSVCCACVRTHVCKWLCARVPVLPCGVGRGVRGKPAVVPPHHGSPAQGQPHPGWQGWSRVSETLRDKTRRLGRGRSVSASLG